MAVRNLSYVKQHRRLAKVRAEKTQLEERTELFTLASVYGDTNMKHAAERLRTMSSNERRELRKSLQRLDYLMDDVSLELMSRRGRTEG